jgi:GT2 family glycosyltransferase
LNSKVSIIILNWNGKKDTIECLDSLKKIRYFNYEIVIVDNGSTDGSVECFKKLYPKIELIENKKNLGFAEGNNVAIRRIIERGTDYVLLLNNDTIVDPDFLVELVNVLKNDSSIGIAGPTVYYYKEKDNIQSAGGKICWYKGKAPHLRNKNDMKINEIRDVDYIMGCSLMAKSELFKIIGYLNKDYFAYWEETEWCVRAKRAGYRIINVPAAKVWHKGGATSKKTSGFQEYQMTRNMFWFMKKHASKIQYLMFIINFIGFQFWFSSFIYVIYHKNLQLYKSFLKGIIDGIRDY